MGSWVTGSVCTACSGLRPALPSGYLLACLSELLPGVSSVFSPAGRRDDASESEAATRSRFATPKKCKCGCLCMSLQLLVEMPL